MKKAMLVGLVLSVSGCGVIIPLVKSESRMQTVTIGDSRQDVVQKMGQPDSAAAPGIDAYLLYSKNTALENIPLGIISLTLTWWMPSFFPSQYPHTYWLYYTNGRLSNWVKTN